MKEIYSKQNILHNFTKTQENILRNYGERYSMSDLFCGFNKLSMEEQDTFLIIRKNQEELLLLPDIISKIREEAKKSKAASLTGVRIIIKNPEYKFELKKIYSKKNEEKHKKPSVSEQAKVLLKNGVITKEEVLEDGFGYDEKQIINMKYSEEPPLNSTAVSIRLCIDQEEVNDATIKFYNETIRKAKIKSLRPGDYNGIK